MIATAGGVRIQADAAQMWQDGKQIGNLYRYLLEGADGHWKARAKKYRLDERWQPMDAEIRFFVEVGGKVELEIRGTGNIRSDVVADGQVHRQDIELEGESLRLI